MGSPLMFVPGDPLQHPLSVDAFLIYVGGVAIYAIIWLYYGLVHMRAQRSGIALVGYGSVGFSVIFTLICFVVAFYR